MPRGLLDGQVALVTGGGTGIGAAVARLFAAEGGSVVVMGRRHDVLEQVAREISGAASPGDVNSGEDVERAVALATEKFGGLDILVVSAGIGTGGSAGDTDDALWRQTLGVNLTGAFLSTRAVLPALISRGGGSIVLIASTAALVAGPGIAAYATSKAGLLGLARSIAVDYGRQGIRANAICPGWVRTAMTEDEMDVLAKTRGISRNQAFDLLSSGFPLGRVAEPEEIAAACLFLASSQASFVTGSALVVDGGAGAVELGGLAIQGSP